MNVGSIRTCNTGVVLTAAVSLPRQEVANQVQTEPMTDSRQVKQMVEEMQSYIDRMNISLSFSTYGENGQNIAVSVINKDTGDIIREIPTKEIQNLYTKMNAVAGIIFNAEA